MPRKRNPGGQPKPEHEKHSYFLRVRLTAEEHGRVKAAADAAGLSLSSWVRARLLQLAKRENK